MRLRRLHRLLAVSLLFPLSLVALARPVQGARALPDSLEEVRSRFAALRPSDPALLSLAERVVSRRESARGARPADVAEALELLGRIRLMRAEYPLADSIFTRALALRRAERRPAPQDLVHTMVWLAEAQRVAKRLSRADSTATEALALAGRLSVRDTSIEIRLHNTLGNVYAERRQGARAVEELALAVRLAESVARPDSLLLGQACRNLGRARIGIGDVRGARAAYARAASIQEQALGGEHPELATTLFMSAMAASEAGDYVAQRRFAERALTIRERVFGLEHPVVAITASTLGSALSNLGDLERALPLYERAVAIQRAAPRQNSFDLSLALNNLGSACLAVGDGARAKQCLEEARAVREKAFGESAGFGLWSRSRVAQALSLMGDRAGARAEIERAIALVDSSNLESLSFDLIEALTIEGAIAIREGRSFAALGSFERAYALADSLLGPSSPRTLDALSYRAIVRAQRGREAEAWADARQLEIAGLEVLQQSARALSEREALAFERSRSSGLEVMLSLAVGPEDPGAEARVELADALIRARLLVLDQLADERRALPGDDPALEAPIRELEEARDALASALVAALREERAPDSTVARARARREAAERALARRSERFGLGLRRSGAGFADVAAALPEGSAMISYVRHEAPSERLLESGARDSSRADTRRYSALVFRKGVGAPEIVSLGSAARLDAAISRWVEACATPPPAAAALARAAERRCNALGRTVRELALDPMTRLLGGAARVFIVPDGALVGVNFMALPDARGGYRAESGPTLHRLSAERDLLPWDDAGRRGRGLLAMGGADFDRAEDGALSARIAAAPPATGARATPSDSARLRFPPLPRTGAEVEQVVSLWHASRSADAADAEALTGAAASEAAFKRLAPGRRVLHVATHGFALGAGLAAAARPGTRAIGSVVSAGRVAERRRSAPLLPGLALAGANAEAVAGADDGFLTAEEITSLDLTGSEWAVLSACETGLSDPSGAEAVQGLQRAFRRAGLRTVIMSLWAVDDEGTRAWMRQLYSARLIAGADTAEAVRSACRTVLEERRRGGLDTHPFHWAAFVAAGDWR